MTYFNNTFFLSSKTTGSTITMQGDKNGGVADGVNTNAEASTSTNVVAEKETTSSTGTPDNTVAEEPAGFFGGANGFVILFAYAAVIGLFYFLTVAPRKKRDKQMQEMRTGLQIGDEVVTTAGYYGKIVDIGTDVFVIEFGTNKGVRIPVKKTEVLEKATPNFTKPTHEEEKK